MLSTQHIAKVLAAVLVTVSALSMSACQPSTPKIEQNADDTKQSVQDALSDWSCQTRDAPFAHSVCQIKAATLSRPDYSLKLFWRQLEGTKPLVTFDNLINTLPLEQSLVFAMNAGMYNQSYAPIGYTVIEGEEIKSLNLKEGGGNFHLLPNGVLWWDKSGKVHISESNALSAQLKNAQAQPWYATQSGPMLVIDGEIHPKFNQNGTSKKPRNGVGICDDGNITFMISDEPVNFYAFATLFKDDLNCSNALFLDGGIASALYAPSINRHDKQNMAVMIGVVETKK